jgi:hypothetical protein
MAKLFPQTLMLLLPALAFAQCSSTSSAYQPAIIVDARPLTSPERPNLDEGLYEVSMTVGRTFYVVLTPLASPSETTLYSAGRQLQVRIGDDAITWTDTMGQCYKSPIINTSQIDDKSKPQD